MVNSCRSPQFSANLRSRSWVETKDLWNHCQVTLQPPIFLCHDEAGHIVVPVRNWQAFSIFHQSPFLVSFLCSPLTVLRSDFQRLTLFSPGVVHQKQAFREGWVPRVARVDLPIHRNFVPLWSGNRIHSRVAPNGEGALAFSDISSGFGWCPGKNLESGRLWECHKFKIIIHILKDDWMHWKKGRRRCCDCHFFCIFDMSFLQKIPNSVLSKTKHCCFCNKSNHCAFSTALPMSYIDT